MAQRRHAARRTSDTQPIHVWLINLGGLVHPMHRYGHFFTVNAWAEPGSVYPFLCHILAHVMNPGQASDEMGGLIVLVKYAA